MVKVLAGGDAVDRSLFVVFIKERHQADLALTVSQKLFHLSDVLPLHVRDGGCWGGRCDERGGTVSFKFIKFFLLLLFVDSGDDFKQLRLEVVDE